MQVQLEGTEKMIKWVTLGIALCVTSITAGFVTYQMTKPADARALEACHDMCTGFGVHPQKYTKADGCLCTRY